jgi:hypothetical protein
MIEHVVIGERLFEHHQFELIERLEERHIISV